MPDIRATREARRRRHMALALRLYAAGAATNTIDDCLGTPRGTVRLWKSRYPDFRQQMEQARHRYLTDQRQRYAEIVDGWQQMVPDPARPVSP